MGTNEDMNAWDMDDDYTEFHELYIQRHGLEFMMPILFEDGMDYIECELYYASLTSQSYGGAFRKLRSMQPRRPTLRELKDEANGNRLSCLRKPTRGEGVEHKCGPPVRRCSFSGMPQIEEFQPLTRSNSMRRLGEEEARVSFEEYVQVVTIYPAEEYPEDVRTQMWMSREELSKCMRRAMIEDMKEQREKQREERAREREGRDQNSNDDNQINSDGSNLVAVSS
jgi:hypothetical protein